MDEKDFESDEQLLSQLFEVEFDEINPEEVSFDVNFNFEPDMNLEDRHNQIDQFLDSNQNKNTKKKTEKDVSAIHTFLCGKGEVRHIEFIPPTQLDVYLCEYLISASKKDGGDYEPCTLRAFISSFDRYLRSKRYPCTIVSSIEFAKTRETLKCKQKLLKNLGKGNKPMAADPISDETLEKMYNCGTLGDSRPEALLHSLWIICTVHFGMRTGQEAHSLRWGDILLREDENGKYLVLDTERQTKTRTGANARDTRACKPRAYQTNKTDQDPVHLYEVYRSKRPADMMDQGSPFFLAVNNKHPKPHEPWFKRQALGLNTLYGFMKTMLKDAGIETDKRITPYSLRKHLVQKLSDEGVPAHHIVQVTGHKNINSINNYNKLNPNQMNRISSILSNVPSCTTGASVQNDSPKETGLAQKPQCAPGSSFPAMFSGNTFSGPVSFHFDNKTSMTHTQTAVCGSPKRSVSEDSSPVVAKKKWARIRMLDSDSD